MEDQEEYVVTAADLKAGMTGVTGETLTEEEREIIGEAYVRSVARERATVEANDAMIVQHNVEIDLAYLLRLVGDYELALDKEAMLARDEEDLTLDLAIYDARNIEEGYESGAIAGKNAEQRARSETIYLTDDDERFEIVAALDELKHRHALAHNNVKALETKLSMLRAWLYSRGAPRF